MILLQNPLERHIITTPPHKQFIQTSQNIINPPNIVDKEIYNFIKQNNEPLIIQIMTNKFSFLPEKLLT